MKKLFTFIALIAFASGLFGQNKKKVLKALDSSMFQFNMAYAKLKDFRNDLNKAEKDFYPEPCSELMPDRVNERHFVEVELNKHFKRNLSS